MQGIVYDRRVDRGNFDVVKRREVPRQIIWRLVKCHVNMRGFR